MKSLTASGIDESDMTKMVSKFLDSSVQNLNSEA